MVFEFNRVELISIAIMIFDFSGGLVEIVKIFGILG